jgi:serine/threonine protein phosphatase PrpC
MFLEVFGHTDKGKKRANNEDSYICYSFKNSRLPYYLLAVADGMGGHQGGEIASALAVETIRENARSKFSQEVIPGSEYAKLLETSIQQANKEIFSRAAADKDLTGMGSTMVAALISNKKTYISNVGDSRAYLIRGKNIEQITIDHNWKSEQLQKGQLSEEDIKNSPYKDLITRSLGLYEEAKIDTFEVDARPEDYLLLCSDGLHSLLSKKEILKTFTKFKNPKKISRRLIDSANKKGGHDNITVIVAHFLKEDSERRSLTDTVRLDFPKN